jgi:transposase
MWEGFTSAIKELFVNAKIVYDRFHVGASHVGMSINTYEALWTEKGKDRWER